MTYSAEFSLQADLDNGLIVVADDDQLDAAVDRMLNAGRLYHAPTVFVRERPRFGPAEIPDHGLKLAFDPASDYGALAYFGAVDGQGGSWVTKSETVPAAGPTLYRDFDSATAFPPDALVPLSIWRSALHEFLATGGARPTSVAWQPVDSW